MRHYLFYLNLIWDKLNKRNPIKHKIFLIFLYLIATNEENKQIMTNNVVLQPKVAYILDEFFKISPKFICFKNLVCHGGGAALRSALLYGY